MKNQLELIEISDYYREERNRFSRTINEFDLSIAQKVIIENFLIAYDNMRNEILERKDLKELSEKVREMRTAQKSYFKTRSPKFLEDSRILEKEADDLVFEVLRKKSAPSPQQSEIPF